MPSDEVLTACLHPRGRVMGGGQSDLEPLTFRFTIEVVDQCQILLSNADWLVR